jgi:hypothetical protein
MFDLSQPADRIELERVASLGDQPETASWDGIESRGHALRRLAHSTIVTDDNMVPEWESALTHR